MSVARKDWSALSSLARQWSLEDEEEQQRERRRRSRALSSTSEEASPQRTPNGEQPATERLQSPEEVPAPRPSAPPDEEQDVQALLRKRRQRWQAGGAGDPIQEQPEAEEARPQRPAPQKEAELQPPERLNPARHSPSAREEGREGGEPGRERKGVPDKTPLTPETPDTEKPVPEKALAKRLTSEETPTSRKFLAAEKTSVLGRTEAAVPKPGLERKPSVRERCSIFERPPAPKETGSSSEKKSSALERSSSFKKVPGSGEKSSVLERSSAFEKPPGPGEKSSVLERSSAFEKPSAPREKSSVLERSSGFEKPLSPREKSTVLEKSSAFEKTSAPREKPSILERSSVFEKPPVPGEKSSVLEKSSTFEKPLAAGKPAGMDRRVVSEKAQMFEKPQGSEKGSELPRLALRRTGSERLQVREQPAPRGNPSAPGEQGARTLPDKRPPYSAKPEEPVAASQQASPTRFPPISFQFLPSPDEGPPRPILILGLDSESFWILPEAAPDALLVAWSHGTVEIPSREDKADMPSPTQATSSTELKRSGFSTISFRMSPRRKNAESSLTRSASLKLSATPGTGGRNENMQERMQKYHSAIKRSESVKTPGAFRTELLISPKSATNVANKRHFFENDLASGSRADRVSSLRENLKLKGAVTSKLSLWESQESPEQDPQELQKDLVATRRTQRERQAESALDAEV
ncbi:ladinin-1 [Sorex fumeus]|uniref:ladinin-1 n=1 Tax=Sorex fumeus TaxID=62283 RepID=UPI0024AE6500|nr:ladinin-1 [Sorex fumeus]